MAWTDFTNLAFAVTGLTIMVAGLAMSIVFHTLKPWTRRFFIIMYAILIVYTASDLLSQISLIHLGQDYGWLSKTAIFLESLFSSLTMPMLTVLLLNSCKDSREKHSLVWIVSGLWGLYLILLIFTQFTDVIYTVSERNIYQRGPWYPILLVPPALLMIANFIALLNRRKQLNVREKWAFLSFILIPLVSMIVQMFFYGLLLIVTGTSISAFILFLVLAKDQAETMRLQQEENAANDGSHIRLSNIRERLKSVQGSSLEIKPREGGGTIARIHLPQP